MSQDAYTKKDLEFTAAVYATRRELVDQVREKGTLPKKIFMGGFPYIAKSIIEKRGFDLVLTEDEQLIYDAILRELRLPGADVIIIRQRYRDTSGDKREGT